MGKQSRRRYGAAGGNSARAGTENKDKDRGLNITDGPEAVVFDAPKQGSKPSGVFKTNIKALAEYVGTSFGKDAHIAAKALRDGEIPQFEDAGTITKEASFMDQVIWKENYLKIQAQERNWEGNNAAIFNLLLQHCTLALKTKLQGQPDYPQIVEQQDGIALRQEIQKILLKRDGRKAKMLEVLEADKRLYTMFQGRNETLDSYLRAHVEQCEAVRDGGGHPGYSLPAARIVAEEQGIDFDALTDDAKKKEVMDAAAERYLAALFFSGLNKDKYESFKNDMHNSHIMGGGRLPETYEEVLWKAEEFRPTKVAGVAEAPGVGMPQVGEEEDNQDNEKGVVAVQTNADGTKTNKAGRKDCFHCGATDHWVGDCPHLSPAKRAEVSAAMRAGTYRAPTKEQQKENARAKPGANMMIVAGSGGDGGDGEEGGEEIAPGEGELEDVAFLQRETEEPRLEEARRTLSPDKLYLDTCSSFHMCFTKKHMRQVVEVGQKLSGDCNAGTTYSSQKGWVGRLFHVWLVENGIANVLSVGQLEQEGFHISYETGGDWVVRTPEGKSLRFQRDTGMTHGFPYLDLSDAANLEGYSCVQTMRKKYEGFTKREVEKAILARKMQLRIGIPSDREFMKLVSRNQIKNADFTVQDIANALVIFGPCLENTRGKTVRRKPDPVVVERIDLDLRGLTRFVTLTADVMFVNGNAFLVTRSRRIRLLTAEYIPARTAGQLSSSVKKIVNLYARAGFTVDVVLMDQEFDKIVDEILLAEVNTTAAREHVAEIERAIRVIKERCRGILSTLPFKYLPRRVLIHLVYFAILWLNASPVKNGISEEFSPREIIMRRALDFVKHARAQFGEYIEADWHDSPSNTMKARTYPAIYLGPTGNIQGTIKALDLNTGEVKKPRTFTPYPMPDRVIKAVNKWGKRDMERDARSQECRLEFRNRVKERFAWDNDDLEEEIANDRDAIRSSADRTIAHANLPAEHPGITLESEVVEDGAVDVVLDSDNQQSREAAENAGFLHGDRESSTGVSHDVTGEEGMEVLVENDHGDAPVIATQGDEDNSILRWFSQSGGL